MEISFEKPVGRFDVRPQIVADDLYLVHGHDAFQLGEIEARIWSLCDGDHSVDDIAQMISTEYEVGLEVAKNDASEFIDSLRNSDLLDK
ncbi:PqqD family protein [Paenarthrobacter nitroguajacolicus]|uniref:PqqD family protein n=1 Tax=Paenarthrobacter nitroguajacolicus TaxID=211146 RepID=UPI003ADF06DF